MTNFVSQGCAAVSGWQQKFHFYLQEDKVVELMKLNLLRMMVVFLVHMVVTEVGHGFLPDQGASSPTYQELLEVAWTQSFYIMNVKL